MHSEKRLSKDGYIIKASCVHCATLGKLRGYFGEIWSSGGKKDGMINNKDSRKDKGSAK